ncbi:MAG TPA: glutamine synthetase family protein, partial [Candidatus Lokiarchaeia archaeon]|nr:glutamine synthetase family protein [Candidatus Lokiarchaeia archaeon]
MASREDVLDQVTDKRCAFVRIWFTDVLGSLKSFAITANELEDAFEDGLGFDGSSIRGFTGIDESDVVGWPDPATFVVLPWRPQEKSVGRMFADVKNPDGSPLESDPRYVLKKALAKAAEQGYTYYVGPELEYFYFANNFNPEFIDQAGYFDQSTEATDIDLRRDTVLALEAMGIYIEKSHHEVAQSQHEIDMKYAEGLRMADNTITYKYTVKSIARRHGVYATFMPKPIAGINGSGMHCHQSLFQGDRNAFWDPADEYHLSATAKSYIAGLLKYAPEFSLVTSP